MNEKEKIIKSSKGITLIALVVTIIVLIILAAVSINLVLGDNGLITKAKQGSMNYAVAANEEAEGLESLLGEINTIIGGISEPTEPETPVEYAPYDNPYIPAGFTHTGGTWNSGYTITETATGNKFVWVPCVLDQSKVKAGDTVVTFGKILPSTTDTTDPYYMYNKHNLTITGDASPAGNIRTSVGTYGGFYIAAYEAGVPVDENGTEIAETSATTSQKARSVAGANTWTNISRTNAIAAATNMVNSSVAGVNSGLISGEAWDTTLQWMVNASENSANEPNVGYDTNSAGKGWYSDVSVDDNGNKVKTTTGQYPINNIYDMAGNVWEWTTENCTLNGTSYLVNRGGRYATSGSKSPAADRGNDIDGIDSDGWIAFRVVLYK